LERGGDDDRRRTRVAADAAEADFGGFLLDQQAPEGGAVFEAQDVELPIVAAGSGAGPKEGEHAGQDDGPIPPGMPPGPRTPPHKEAALRVRFGRSVWKSDRHLSYYNSPGRRCQSGTWRVSAPCAVVFGKGRARLLPSLGLRGQRARREPRPSEGRPAGE